jgi:hypothetical protein
MDVHFNILIDASGSMGYMKGSEDENKYLLPDGNTRMDLVKKILSESLIETLSFTKKIKIYTFKNSYHFNKDGTKKLKQKKVIDKNGKVVLKNYHSEYPDLKLLNKDILNTSSLKEVVNNIENPLPGGTPLWWSLSVLINKIKPKRSTSIIVLSDGDASDKVNFDSEILDLLKKENKNCTIHFIGINQNKEARLKSENLCRSTGGIYVNLEAMDYNSTELDLLMSKLNSTIVTKTLKDNIESTKSLSKENEANLKIEEKSTGNLLIEKQVEKNTQSLEYISSQLSNILNLLHARDNSENEEVLVTENTIHNQRIGRASEKYLFKELKQLFINNKDTKVSWVNENEEQGLPYDILVQKNNETFYYECKGTSSDLNEFQLTKNEWNFYLDNRKKYRLCFVSNIDSTPSYIRFMDLLNDIENKKLIPCSSKNKNFKANRIVFQVL